MAKFKVAVISAAIAANRQSQARACATKLGADKLPL
jgi:hypothetical protein